MADTTVTIGIHLGAGDVDQFELSLAALRAHTTGAPEVVVMPDFVDSVARERLTAYGLRILEDADKQAGPASCFNRLVRCSNAQTIVFLEAGSIPGTNWLELLVEPLHSAWQNGLAGPSTNFAWNEQCAFMGSAGSLTEVARTAHAAGVRFGHRWYALPPRHALADFCLAVRRDVAQAVGPAHANTASAHRWDMDLAIRASRAGFRSVWACSSYVWRSPSAAKARRTREESTARVLYAGGNYRIALSNESSPLVSCIMATRDRREYVLQSIRYFERDDYANRELIIVDDGTDDLASVLPASDRIRYVRVPAGTSIGAKRNRGCELAHGTIIAQWDDDDWYAPRRLTAQLAPIIAGQADITALKEQLFFDLPGWKFWACLPMLHRQIFVEDVMGGTLVYRRACWEKLSRYPDCSLAEDASFLRQAVARGARLRRISEPCLLLYLRHYSNSWRFECGKFVDPNGWANASEPACLKDDRAFYLSRSRTASPAVASAHATDPLVSCIMPTANRHRFIPHAIRYFLRQTYANRELLILDDGEVNIAELVPASERIRHIRLGRRHSTGAKRNLACELAQGEIIVHWDDDDWIADWRLAYQVEVLRKHPSPAACGLSKLYFSEPSVGRAWLYCHPADQRAWVAGGTLGYDKSLWRDFPFADLVDGEDTAFVASVPEDSIVKLLDNRFYVATVHAGNTSRKITGDPRWHPISSSAVRAIIAEDWLGYKTAADAQALAVGSRTRG